MIIRRKIPIEDIISRIPGLFPYIQQDEYGVVQLYSAINGYDGCYGKVIPDLKVNFNMSNPDAVDSDDNPIEVFKSGEFYSYRTLMNHYYRLKKLTRTLNADEESLIKFIDKGIGRIEVDESIKGRLVPTYMYLAEIREWWEWFQKMKPLCDCTKKPQSKNESDCCACGEYCDKGGDAMYDFLRKHIGEVDVIAKEYYDLAKDGDGNFKGHINLNLLFTTEIDDMGIGLMYSQEWVPGKAYHVGEIVLYNDESWILVKGEDGNEENLFYGYYNSKIDEIEFDDPNGTHWKKNVVKTEGEITLNKDEFYKKDVDPNVYSLPINSYYVSENDTYVKLAVGTIENVEGVTNSKLISLRRLKRLVDDKGEESIPNNESQVDWCCLYEKSKYGGEEYNDVLNIQTWVDENGNITYYENWDDMTVYNVLSPGNDKPSGYENNLLAFGDILDKIDKDEKTQTITFTYYIGAHLIGGGINTVTSTTEPTQYRFSGFKIDDKHKGVEYTETYYYDKETFGEYNTDLRPSENLENNPENKGEFYTTGSKLLIKSNLGNNGKILSNILADFTTEITEPDYIYSKDYRTDELIGVSFEPIVDANIVVDRGINSAFERHLKLGEVKTLDDLVNYGNNFFNVKSIN